MVVSWAKITARNFGWTVDSGKTHAWMSPGVPEVPLALSSRAWRRQEFPDFLDVLHSTLQEDLGAWLHHG